MRTSVAALPAKRSRVARSGMGQAYAWTGPDGSTSQGVRIRTSRRGGPGARGRAAGRVSGSLDLLLRVDRGGGPLRAQLEDQLRDAVRAGRLGPGAALPSSRALARELSVSRGVVVEVYAQLAAEGYLVARQGAPTRVSEAASPGPGATPAAAAERPPRYDFRTGRPDVSLFPRGAWLASLRRALRDEAAGDPVGAVMITPAHQFPLGVVLAPDRRAALLDWAAHTGAVVLEDDYDAEYRYDRQPVGAVQGLAPDRVAYAGSTSKTLAPGLRLGWLVVPDHLLEAVTAAKASDDLGTPVVEQLALADFLERGQLDRHLRRTRAVYRARRDALVDALERLLPDRPPA